jgi:hypothetical protein|nr:hypothetical protein [Desulfovermiculus halophilus]
MKGKPNKSIAARLIAKSIIAAPPDLFVFILALLLWRLPDIFLGQVFDDGADVLDTGETKSYGNDDVKGPGRSAQGRGQMFPGHGIHQVLIGKPGHHAHDQGADDADDQDENLFHLRRHGVQKGSHPDVPGPAHPIADAGEGGQHDQESGYFLREIEALKKGAGNDIGNEQYCQGGNTENQDGDFNGVDRLPDSSVQTLYKRPLFILGPILVHGTPFVRCPPLRRTHARLSVQTGYWISSSFLAFSMSFSTASRIFSDPVPPILVNLG